MMLEHKRKPGRPRKQGRRNEAVWCNPTIRDVYAQVLVAKDMLDRISDPKLNNIKKEIDILEKMIWNII
mgnify:FL=1